MKFLHINFAIFIVETNQKKFPKSMELHLDVDAGVAEYIEETGLGDQLTSFLSQVCPEFVFTINFQ
jgi:hypothetical protein